jgi:hypothetical protein
VVAFLQPPPEEGVELFERLQIGTPRLGVEGRFHGLKPALDFPLSFGRIRRGKDDVSTQPRCHHLDLP